jgi:hypothetical protein
VLAALGSVDTSFTDLICIQISEMAPADKLNPSETAVVFIEFQV